MLHLGVSAPLPAKPTGFTHRDSKSSWSAVPDLCSASRPGPLRGLLVSLASLDPCARLRLLASMIFAARAGPVAGFAQQRSWNQMRRIGTALSPQGEREAFGRAKRA